MVLIPHMDKESAINLAEQIRKEVEDRCVLHMFSGVSDHVTISMGINTIIPSDETSIGEFISNADKALYKAKENAIALCFYFKRNSAAVCRLLHLSYY